MTFRSLCALAGRWLIPALFALSLAMLARGLATTPYILTNMWPQRPQTQAMTIFLIAVALNGLLAVVARNWQRPLLRGVVAATGIGALTLAFGWQAAGAALLTLGTCFCMGHLFFCGIRCLHPRSHMAARAISMLDICAVGLGLTVLLLTVAGVAQIDMPTLYIALLIAPPALVLLVPAIRQRLADDWLREDTWRPDRDAHEKGFSYTRFVMSSIVAAGLLYYVAACTLPEVSWDGLVMHLLVPSQILMRGHWTFDQTLYAFAPWPIGTDYLFGMAMLAGGELGAKCLNLTLFFVLLAQLFGLVQRRYGRDAAWACVALFITMPLAITVTSGLYVENMLAVLTMAGLRMLDDAEESDSATTLIGMAVLMGALAAVKMHGLFLDAFFVLALCAVPFWKKLSARAWMVAGVVATLAAVAGLLTYLYAWVKTGNPIFMFKNSFFHSPYWSQDDFLDKRWMDKLSWGLLYDMTFKSQAYTEALPGTIGFAFAAFLPSGVAALCMWYQRYQRGLVIVTAGFIAFMLSQTQYIRYLYPAMPALLVICAASFEPLRQIRFWQPSSRPLSRHQAFYGLVVVLALLGFYKFPAGDWVLKAMDFSQIWNPAGRSLEIAIAAPERLANDVINAAGMPDPHVVYGVLPFGGNLRGTPFYTDWYNYTLHKGLDEATDDAQIAALLADRQADFLIVNDASDNPIYKKLAAFGRTHFPPYARLGRLTIYVLR